MTGANIISAIQNLKMAQEQLEDFCREFPNSQGQRIFKNYSKKIDWIFNDIITHPFITTEVIIGIKNEIQSDVFAVPAINEKISLLTPDQREIIESTLDAMINGEEVKIVDINEINK
jgi:Fe-S cluster biosynthesis and repair protein YggX